MTVWVQSVLCAGKKRGKGRGLSGSGAEKSACAFAVNGFCLRQKRKGATGAMRAGKKNE